MGRNRMGRTGPRCDRRPHPDTGPDGSARSRVRADTAGSGVPGRPVLPGTADRTGRPSVRRHAHRPGVSGWPLRRPDTSAASRRALASCRTPGNAATGCAPTRDSAPRDATSHAATDLATTGNCTATRGTSGDRTAARGTTGDRTTAGHIRAGNRTAAGHAVHRWPQRHAGRDLRTSTEDVAALRAGVANGGVACGPRLHRVLVDGC